VIVFIQFVVLCVLNSEEQRLDQLAMKQFYDNKLHDAVQPSQQRSVTVLLLATLPCLYAGIIVPSDQ